MTLPNPQKQNPAGGRGFVEQQANGRGLQDNHSANPATEFRAAMRAAGIPTDAEILADGQLRRVHVEGDRRAVRDGWYVLHLAPVPAGAFGHWRTGRSQAWRPHDRASLTPGELASVDAAVAAAKAQRDTDLAMRQRDAQTRAHALWGRAVPAQCDHPYLQAKRVRPHGIRQHGDALLIPMRDIAGALWATQSIAPDGAKRFLSGSRKTGLYFSLGESVVDVLLIAEGFATGATLHEATGHPVAVAFDAGNLTPVAVALRTKYPRTSIVVCADDDAATAARIGRNPGRDSATRAAAAVGGVVALPTFGSRA